MTQTVGFLILIWNIWLELSPWMLLGAFVAGLMHVLIPEGWIKRQLSGQMGILKAVVIGVPLPLCSCGVIPVGLGLRKNGASSGSTVGFLISTPQTGIDSILISASFLGWPFAILKVVTALVTGLVGGYITNLSAVQAEDVAVRQQDTSGSRRGVMAMFQHAEQLIRSIWKWLLFGVVVSAAISHFLPEEYLAQYSAFQGVSALLLTLLISLPLYVCATASVPIAAALVASGFPPGAALVFLMAGPATNVATLGAVYRTLGGRSLAAYLGTIVLGSLLAGVLFNSLIDGTATLTASHSHHLPWWAALSGVLLAVLVLRLAVQDGIRWYRKRNKPDEPVFVELGAPPK